MRPLSIATTDPASPMLVGVHAPALVRAIPAKTLKNTLYANVTMKSLQQTRRAAVTDAGRQTREVCAHIPSLTNFLARSSAIASMRRRPLSCDAAVGKPTTPVEERAISERHR